MHCWELRDAIVSSFWHTVGVQQTATISNPGADLELSTCSPTSLLTLSLAPDWACSQWLMLPWTE